LHSFWVVGFSRCKMSVVTSWIASEKTYNPKRMQ